MQWSPRSGQLNAPDKEPHDERFDPVCGVALKHSRHAATRHCNDASYKKRKVFCEVWAFARRVSCTPQRRGTITFTFTREYCALLFLHDFSRRRDETLRMIHSGIYLLRRLVARLRISALAFIFQVRLSEVDPILWSAFLLLPFRIMPSVFRFHIVFQH